MRILFCVLLVLFGLKYVQAQDLNRKPNVVLVRSVVKRRLWKHHRSPLFSVLLGQQTIAETTFE
jgi:hypothetical protein